jgi:hypothetical protein
MLLLSSTGHCYLRELCLGSGVGIILSTVTYRNVTSVKYRSLQLTGTLPLSKYRLLSLTGTLPLPKYRNLLKTNQKDKWILVFTELSYRYLTKLNTYILLSPVVLSKRQVVLELYGAFLSLPELSNSYISFWANFNTLLLVKESSSLYLFFFILFLPVCTIS